MKNKWKSSAFWLSVTAGVIVVLNSIGKAFNFNVNTVAIASIATSVIGLLVVIGVLTKTDKNITESTTNIENTTNGTIITEETLESDEKQDEKSTMLVEENSKNLEQFSNIMQKEIDEKIKVFYNEVNNKTDINKLKTDK